MLVILLAIYYGSGKGGPRKLVKQRYTNAVILWAVVLRRTFCRRDISVIVFATLVSGSIVL